MKNVSKYSAGNCTWIDIMYHFVSLLRWLLFFIARCTLVQSAVMRSHVVCTSVRLSVCPSLTLEDCDHIGWSSSEIISPLVSMGCSLSVDPNIRGLLQGKIWPKVSPCWFERRRHSIANYGRMVTDSTTVTTESHIGNHHRSFEWCNCWPPTTSPSPKWGFHMPQDTRMAISPQRLSDTLSVWF